jgi:cytochrome c biogenesis protein CcdA
VINSNLFLVLSNVAFGFGIAVVVALAILAMRYIARTEVRRETRRHLSRANETQSEGDD